MPSRFLLKLDHLAVIAPTLAKGVAYVRDCLDIDVPFGRCHHYMGTRNHRLQLGDGFSLEIVACNRHGTDPGRTRWFGFDETQRVGADRATAAPARPAKRFDALSPLAPFLCPSRSC